MLDEQLIHLARLIVERKFWEFTVARRFQALTVHFGRCHDRTSVRQQVIGGRQHRNRDFYREENGDGKCQQSCNGDSFPRRNLVGDPFASRLGSRRHAGKDIGDEFRVDEDL